MVTAGHAGAVEGWFAGDVRALLDGALAPLRNVHKFDVVLRLPLVLGLAFGRWTRRRRRSRAPSPTRRPDRPRSARPRQPASPLVGMVLLAVAGSVLPAVTGRITPAGATLGVPRVLAADRRLARRRHGDGHRARRARARRSRATSGARPRDEPLQSLADSPVGGAQRDPADAARQHPDARRGRAPAGPGAGLAGLAAYLRRAGVQYVVVRNDLQRRATTCRCRWWCTSRSRQSGLTAVATFGPDVGGGATLERRGPRVVVNGGWQDALPGGGGVRGAGRRRAGGHRRPPPVVVGGPEDLVDLADLGLVGDAPVRLAADVRPRPRTEPPADAGGADRRTARAGAVLRPDPRRLLGSAHPGDDLRRSATRRATTSSTAADRWADVGPARRCQRPSPRRRRCPTQPLPG